MVQKKEIKLPQEYRIFKMIENLVSFGFMKKGLEFRFTAFMKSKKLL
jgi:hypothetical protein